MITVNKVNKQSTDIKKRSDVLLNVTFHAYVCGRGGEVCDIVEVSTGTVTIYPSLSSLRSVVDTPLSSLSLPTPLCAVALALISGGGGGQFCQQQKIYASETKNFF